MDKTKESTASVARPVRVLIVDDEGATRRLLADLVQTWGYTAELAENGYDALRLAKAVAPDVILLDLLMPEMDGMTVLNVLKDTEQTRHIPIIIVTAVDDMGKAVECLDRGAEDVLLKPVHPAFLGSRVRGVIARKLLHDAEEGYERQLAAQNIALERRVAQQNETLQSAYHRLSILDEAKGEFLQVIAHELRTPLTGIVGAGSMLTQTALADDDREKFGKIFQAGSIDFCTSSNTLCCSPKLIRATRARPDNKCNSAVRWRAPRRKCRRWQPRGVSACPWRRVAWSPSMPTPCFWNRPWKHCSKQP